MNRRALFIAVVVGVLGLFLLVLYQRRFELEASGGEKVKLLIAVKRVERGKPITEDVTNELFTMTILIDTDDVKDVALTACLIEGELIEAGDPLADDPLQVADVPIFHSCFEDYFWNYDNNGLKLLQLRFFQVPQDQ